MSALAVRGGRGAAAAALQVVAAPSLVVVDGAGGWESAGRDVRVLEPEALSPEEVLNVEVSRVVVNLAARGVLRALAALREAGSEVRFWGCLADAGADRALPLGLVEPLARPLDPDHAATLLAPIAPKGARVVTIGADIDALVSLRYTLTRQGMSVSMAWDARQAVDLLALVRPDVVVLDLDLPGREAFGILARLGGADRAPIVALLPASDDAALPLAAALAEPVNAGRAVPLARMLGRFVAARA